jgi:HlyD family secretion protein
LYAHCDEGAHAVTKLEVCRSSRIVCDRGANTASMAGAMSHETAVGADVQSSSPKGPVVRSFRARYRRYLVWLKILPIAIVIALVARHRFVAPMAVRRHIVDRGDVVREVFGRATIESRREVALGFDLVGRISDVVVDEGDRVKLGQVVAHLAPEQWNTDVHAAASGVSLARAAQARLAADERRAEATLTFAQQEAARMRRLAADGTVNARDLDLAEQQLALAKADVDRVRAAQGEAVKQIAVASGASESKAVTVSRAVLVSPFDGMVIRRFKDPGDTVTVGSSVLRIVSVDRLWARAAVDESMLVDLREGMPAEIALLGDAKHPLHGTVDRIGREVDRQTHEVLVDVLLAEVPSRLAIGQRADVHITLERRTNVARIPLAFVRRDADDSFTFVDSAGRIARAPLQIGAVGRDFVEVTAGLEPGTIVLDAPKVGGALTLGRRWDAAP